MEQTKITILDKGPIIIDGKISITYNGVTEEKEKVALCRCGYSENKPYCDGKHKNCPTTDNL